MDDFERYGDYNETEEDNPKKRNIPFFVLKLVAGVLIFAVCALVGARLVLFNYYPGDMKKLCFTPDLTEYYYSNQNTIDAFSQKLRAPYDNPNEGNFFCGELIVVPDAGHLQICMKYNESIRDSLKYNYGVDGFDTEDHGQFSFRLVRSGDEAEPNGYETGRLVDSQWDSFAMYRYCRLSFDDVSFSDASWIRLEIFIDGINDGKPFMVAIYENNDDYSKFTNFRVRKGDLPK